MEAPKFPGTSIACSPKDDKVSLLLHGLQKPRSDLVSFTDQAQANHIVVYGESGAGKTRSVLELGVAKHRSIYLTCHTHGNGGNNIFNKVEPVANPSACPKQNRHNLVQAFTKVLLAYALVYHIAFESSVPNPQQLESWMLAMCYATSFADDPDELDLFEMVYLELQTRKDDFLGFVKKLTERPMHWVIIDESQVYQEPVDHISSGLHGEGNGSACLLSPLMEACAYWAKSKVVISGTKLYLTALENAANSAAAKRSAGQQIQVHVAQAGN